jgi:hypothetical protein
MKSLKWKTLCIMFALAACVSWSDSGDWYSAFQLESGPIYSEKENEYIAMSEEMLRYLGNGWTEVHFLFRNTSDRDITLDAGFPIRTVFMQGNSDNNYISIVNFDDNFVGKFLTDIYEKDLRREGSYKIPRAKVEKRVQFSYADFVSKYKDWMEVSIEQDGVKRDVSTVVLEARLVDKKSLEIDIHFKHALTFPAKASSTVSVRYQNWVTVHSGGIGVEDEWNYILGTGRTWKGPIGRLYLLLPPQSKPDLPKAFRLVGEHGGYLLYLASDYEPAESDLIRLSHTYEPTGIPSYLEQKWFGKSPVYAPKPNAPASPFVVVHGASSSLKQTVAVYTEAGIIKDADFSPLSLVDGVRETCWCEGRSDDGIGEWVEVKLTEAVAACEIQNGFVRSLTEIPGKDIHTFFQKNNRVKTLEISSTDGRVLQTLDLADAQTLQRFNLDLFPGTCRFTIRSVYPGATWKDTCMGEIIFYRSNPEAAKLLAEDEFFARYF